LQARPPAKPARHSPEAKPMADGPTCHCEARAGRQGEAAWGTSGQVTIGMMEQWKIGEQQEQFLISFEIHHSIIPWKWHKPVAIDI